MKRRWVNVIAFVGAVAIAAVFAVPIVWIVVSSLKSPLEVTRIPPTLAFTPTTVNYHNLVFARGAGRAIMNSAVVSILTVLACGALGTLAGYGLARLRGVASRQLAFYFLSTRFAPPVAAVLPLFVLFRTAGLLDTKAALIIAYTAFNMPLVIWMMRQFFMELPPDLEEAALIDGASQATAFLKVSLPLVAPGLAATAVLVFIFSWNEFLYALILSGGTLRTLPVMSASFATDRLVLWGELSAAAVISFAPVAVFAVILQRYLLRGLTFGAIK